VRVTQLQFVFALDGPPSLIAAIFITAYLLTRIVNYTFFH
jgi:hypothetical protein